MKVDLLLTEDGGPQFYGGVHEGLEEADPPHHGLRGWLERERKRLATLWRHDDSRVMRALHRIWDWLNRRIYPDEVWLIRLRSAAAIEVRHPTTLTAADASVAWAEFLEGRKRRHLAWLVFYAATCPLTLLLVPLPGPNLIGYWCAYRAIRHLMVVLGLFRAGRGRVATTFDPAEALDRPPGIGRATWEDLTCENAAELRGDLGRALYPGDESTREEWLERWCHRLRHEGGEAMLGELCALPWTAAKRCGRSTAR